MQFRVRLSLGDQIVKALATGGEKLWCAVMAVVLLPPWGAARADECVDTGKSFAMMQEMYKGCPGWSLSELGLSRFVAVGSKLEQLGGQRCAKIGNAAMYRTLIEMNPEIEKLAVAKDLPRFSAAVCETLVLRFMMMTEMAGQKPLIEKVPPQAGNR